MEKDLYDDIFSDYKRKKLSEDNKDFLSDDKLYMIYNDICKSYITCTLETAGDVERKIIPFCDEGILELISKEWATPYIFEEPKWYDISRGEDKKYGDLLTYRNYISVSMIDWKLEISIFTQKYHNHLSNIEIQKVLDVSFKLDLIKDTEENKKRILRSIFYKNLYACYLKEVINIRKKQIEEDEFLKLDEIERNFKNLYNK